jgi:hypothetical protein
MIKKRRVIYENEKKQVDDMVRNFIIKKQRFNNPFHPCLIPSCGLVNDWM